MSAPVVMEASSSSKVTVEYHDPSGVFPLVSRDIAARLPLRNLNWQSPSRPLRQIRQLHVEFVPDQLAETALRPPAQYADSTGPNSFDIVRSGRDQRKDALAVKERRHQIPGFKTSPYLKVYVLRCDDKETYKETERKRVREWIRENAHTDGKRGENHAAFEWLILHVVIPDTVAASEPRWRESQSEPDMLKERKTSNMKLPGKGPRTVFDRLRTDFNESSKTGQDRVTQIRLRKSDVAPDLLPTPAVAETLAETAQERENAWKDLMDKFKTLILGPFDARVRQYEADVAEQESRRSLPGWNFCTFFIHKEGLAKALESIGLVEDALSIYDELSFGLETAVRDLASGQSQGTATSFAQHTDDIEARILGKGRPQTNGTTGQKCDGKPAEDKDDLFSKDYREQIVRSNISIFDFFSYLFLRQKTLILRLANTQASRAEMGGNPKDNGEDLVLTSEVCWRAASFIHNNARTLRQDLANGSQTKSPEDIEALVCSWTFAVAAQVLAETAAPVLDASESAGDKALSNGTISGLKRADFAFSGLGANPYPQRSSSLAIKKSKPPPVLQRPVSAIADATFSPPSSSGTDGASKATGIPGLPELATYRAELVMVQRKMLEMVAARREWRAGWALVRHRKASNFKDVALDEEEGTNGETEDGSNEGVERSPKVSGLLSPTLAPALESEEIFQAAYEHFSDQAMRYYALATQNKSVDAIIAELALLKREQGDLEAAETFIRHILPSYTVEGWTAVTADIMVVYAECLKELGQKEEYLKIALDLLAGACEKKMSRKSLTMRVSGEHEEDEVMDAESVLSELIAYSKGLKQEVTRPMERYFTDVVVEQEVKHHNDGDGFALRLRWQHVLDDEVELDEVSARLISVDDANREIWLVSDGSVTLQPGAVSCDLEATTTAYGAYFIDRVVFKAGKLLFIKELQSKPTTPALVLNDDENLVLQAASHKRPWVFLYPREDAFDIQVSVARNIHLEKPRHLEFAVSSGSNEIESIDVKLRPTSAGLRLHLADAAFDKLERRDGEEATPGQLSLGGIGEESGAVVKVPYTVEQTTTDISMRLEARYRTSKGWFTFSRSIVLRHEIPLDVDVDDTFHLDTLFSTFTVRTMTMFPVIITEATLGESPAYAVESPPLVGLPMTVFDKSPAKLIYKISRKTGPEIGAKTGKREMALALRMQYLPADELMAATVRELFAEDLESSQFQSLSRLLLPVMAEQCKHMFSSTDVEMAVMFDHVEVPSYEDFGWKEIVATLPKAVETELTQWLQDWHRKRQNSRIDYQSPVARETLRHITISVDVPTVDFVHSASLSLLSAEQPDASGPQILTLGKPVKARVSIRHTSQWSAMSISGGGKDEKDAPPTFVMGVQAPTDNWIIGGQRRAHFVPREGEATTFDLTLIPLKAGRCALSNIDVVPEPVIEPEARSDRGSQHAVTCETYYESSGTVVQVIRDVRMTRVQIVDSLPADEVLPPSEPGTASQSVTEPG
ncbi:hypothetical protein LTR08_003072 [Meristemomyces frigidus]|nr:hypothetical protein LTR08_003072 [Meristemomyces frigidus]